MKKRAKKFYALVTATSLVLSAYHPINMYRGIQVAYAAEIPSDHTFKTTNCNSADNYYQVIVGQDYTFSVADLDSTIISGASITFSYDDNYNSNYVSNNTLLTLQQGERATSCTVHINDYAVPLFYQNGGIIPIKANINDKEYTWFIKIQPTTIVADSISFSENKVSVLSGGANTSVFLTLKSNTGKTVNEDITVSVSDNQIVECNINKATGNVTLYGKKEGTATITVTTNTSKLSTNLQVTVKETATYNEVTYSLHNSRGVIRKVDTTALSYTLPASNGSSTAFNEINSEAFTTCTNTGLFILPLGGREGGIDTIQSGAFPTDTSTFNVMLKNNGTSDSEISKLTNTLKSYGINVVQEENTVDLIVADTTTLCLNAPTGLTTSWKTENLAENGIISFTQKGNNLMIKALKTGTETISATVTKGSESYSINYIVNVISATPAPTTEPNTPVVTPDIPTPANSTTPTEPAYSNIPTPSDIPSVSDMPTYSEQPNTSSQPKYTDTPDITPMPTDTLQPDVSQLPTVTNIPEPTTIPTITTVPAITSQPTNTNTPAITEAPLPTPPVTNSAVSFQLSSYKGTLYYKGSKDASKIITLKGISKDVLNKSTIRWTSVNKKVAKVTKISNNKYRIIATGTGSTKLIVSVTFNGITTKKMIKVTVKKPSLSIIGNTTVKKGSTTTYRIEKYGLKEKIIWKISNKKFATITKSGKLKAKKKGLIKLTAQCKNVKKTIQIRIK